MKRSHLDPPASLLARCQRDQQMSMGANAYGREMTPPLSYPASGHPIVHPPVYYNYPTQRYGETQAIPRCLPSGHPKCYVHPTGFLQAPSVGRCPISQDFRNQLVMHMENERNQYPKVQGSNPCKETICPIKTGGVKPTVLKTDEDGGVKRVWPSMGFGKLDVRENATGFIIHLDIPGVQKDTIDISLKPNNIVVECVRNPIPHTKNFFHYVERPSGKLVRTIHLSSRVDPDSIACSYKDGVLQITLGKLREDNVIKKLRID